MTPHKAQLPPAPSSGSWPAEAREPPVPIPSSAPLSMEVQPTEAPPAEGQRPPAEVQEHGPVPPTSTPPTAARPLTWKRGPTEPTATARARLRTRGPKAERPSPERWRALRGQAVSDAPGLTLPRSLGLQGDWREMPEEERPRPKPGPRGLMLTDVTPTTLVASWAPARGPWVMGYRIRHAGGVGGQGSAVRLPAHVTVVTYRHLRPGTGQTVCLRVVYSHGVSRPLCESCTTLKGPMPRQILCPRPCWH